MSDNTMENGVATIETETAVTTVPVRKNPPKPRKRVEPAAAATKPVKPSKGGKPAPKPAAAPGKGGKSGTKGATAPKAPAKTGHQDATASELRKQLVTFMRKGKEYSSREVVLGLNRTPGQKEGGPVVNALKRMEEEGLVQRVSSETKRGYSWVKI